MNRRYQQDTTAKCHVLSTQSKIIDIISHSTLTTKRKQYDPLRLGFRPKAQDTQHGS